MTIAVPTLSASGWITGTQEKADYLLSHFYESDKFQSYLYGDNVSNLQYVIEQYGHDVTLLTQRLRSVLQVYLQRYYDSVNIDLTSIESQDATQVGKIQLRLYCSVTEGGKEYSFGRLIEAIDSKLERITKINNTESTS